MADYISQFTGAEIDQRLAKVSQLETSKQDKLVSGSNIKTINGQSVLGSGDMQIQAGDTDAVKYVAQTLTDAQKAQARTNIAAASAAELGQIVTDLTGIEADIDSLEAAVAAINVGDYVTATTLPTASASTMGHIYLIGPDANNNYDRYFTQESSGTYSWVSLGSTQIDLSTYATQAEVDQLEAKVTNISSETVEDGLFIIDSNRNVGVRITDTEIKVSESIYTAMQWIRITNEEGFFIVDGNRNIGVRITDEDFDFIGGDVGGGATIVNDSIPAPQTLIRVDYTTESELPDAKGTVIYGTVKINFDGFVLEKYSSLEVQGKSSARKPKKNFTFGLFNDDSFSEEYKLRIGNMVPHSEFVYKANYGDAAQVRNVGCNKLWEQMIFAHSTPPWRGNEGVYNYDTGALCHVDGFPCVLYVNEQFYGIGWWNIGKKRDNYDMSKNNQSQIQVQAQPRADLTGVFSETYWEIRNPKTPDEYFEGKLNAWFTDNARTGEDFKANFQNHHNLRNAIDYFLFLEFVYDDDGLDNNIMLTSWDGIEFWMLPYDCDSSLGLSYDGSYNTPYNSSVTESTIGGNIMNANTRAFWRKLRDAYKAELSSRYSELKELGIFTVSNINRIVSDAQKRYGPDNYTLESAKWPNIPSLGITSKTQILAWVQNRINWMDEYYYV